MFYLVTPPPPPPPPPPRLHSSSLLSSLNVDIFVLQMSLVCIESRINNYLFKSVSLISLSRGPPRPLSLLTHTPPHHHYSYHHHHHHPCALKRKRCWTHTHNLKFHFPSSEDKTQSASGGEKKVSVTCPVILCPLELYPWRALQTYC